MKGGSCKRRVSKAGRKGPRFLLVSKFYVCHLRFRSVFYDHLPSTSYGLSTRLELIDGLPFDAHGNSLKVGITPILQMKKSKNREVNNLPKTT